MTTWYAQNGSDQYPSAWGSCYWNDVANGSGNSGTPVSGDTADANGHTGIDAADVDLTGITLSPAASNAAWISSHWYARSSNCTYAAAGWNTEAGGNGISKLPGDSVNLTQYIDRNGHTNIDVADVSWAWKQPYNYDYSGFWSSKAYASNSGSWSSGSVYWYSRNDTAGQTIGTLASPPSGSHTTYYANSYDVDMADIDTRSLYLGTGSGSFYSTKWYAMTAAAYASVTWNAEINNHGLSSPGPSNVSGTYIYSNGHAVDMAGVICDSMYLYDYDWWSSTWYIQHSGMWTQENWNAQYQGRGFSTSLSASKGNPDANSTFYHGPYNVDCTDIVMTGRTLSNTGDGSWGSASWYMRHSGDFAAAQWNSEINGHGMTTPGPTTKTLPAFDTCYLNGYVFAFNSSADSTQNIVFTDSSYGVSGSVGVSGDCSLNHWTINAQVKFSAHTLTLHNCSIPQQMTLLGTPGATAILSILDNVLDGSVIVSNGCTMRIETGGLYEGTVEVETGGILDDIGGGLRTTQQGGIRIKDGGKVKLYGTVTVARDYGTWQLDSGAIIQSGPATGDYTDPGQVNVRYGTTYKFATVNKTGSAYIPGADDVRSGVDTDATTGTIVVPIASYLKSGEHAGYYHNTSPEVFEVTGTYNPMASVMFPAETDVRQGVHYGRSNSAPEYQGTCWVPLPGNVWEGIDVDATVGTLAVPSADDVRNGTSVAGGTGNLLVPAAEDVKTGVHAGYIHHVGGVYTYEITGTYGGGSGTVPDPADVRYGTAVGSTTGTAYIPGADDVRSGVHTDATTGSLIVPSADDLRANVHAGYYHSGTGTYEVTGNMIVPDAADVRTNVRAGWHHTGTPPASDTYEVTGSMSGGGSGTIPAASDVRHGVSVGSTTGTCYVPSASDVRYGTNVDSTSGTCYVPVADDVRSSTNVDATVGNLIVPAAGDVKTGVHAGWYHSGTSTYEVTGSYSGSSGTIPNASDVRYGVAVGSTTGTCHVPTAAQTQYGVSVDVSGTGSFTHTTDYVAKTDVVAAQYVLTGHSNYVSGDSGTLTLPAESAVWYGTGAYGVGGTGSNPSKRASSITNCSAGNVKKDVEIDNVTGTYDPLSVAIFPAESHVTTDETAYGPNGNDYAGTIDMATYTLISGVAGADDVRSGTARYTGGANGNLIVPSAAHVESGYYAGWHHTGPDTYEVSGTLTPSGTVYTDPGEAHVESGVQYTFNDVSKEGTYDPMAAAVFPAPANVTTAETAYGPTGAEYAGLLNMSTYVLKSNVVAAAHVAVGYDNYVGGSSGTFNPMAAAVFPLAANVSTTETAYGPTGVEYSGALNMSLYTLLSVLVWPAEAHVTTAETGYGPTGTEYSGQLDMSLYVPVSSMPSLDDIRDGVNRGDGQYGNLIVPDASDLAVGAYAGWHHTGTPPAADTYEVTGTASVVLDSPIAQSTGMIICYDNRGRRQPGARLTMSQVTAPDNDPTGHAYDQTPRILTADANGVAQATGLWQTASYMIRFGVGNDSTFKVPDETSFQFPTLLGSSQFVFVGQF